MKKTSGTSKKAKSGTLYFKRDLREIPSHRRRISVMLRERSAQKDSLVLLCSPTSISAVSLIDVDGREALFSNVLWADLLDTAASFGWIPEGTTLAGGEVYQCMCGYQPVRDGEERDKTILKAISHFLHFDGGYVPQSPYDRIFIDDVSKIADALDLCLQLTPTDECIWPPDQRVAPNRVPDVIAFQRQAIQDFIGFVTPRIGNGCRKNCENNCSSCSVVLGG